MEPKSRCYNGSFHDGNGVECTYGDIVQYKYAEPVTRYAKLGEVLQDGDATIFYLDNGQAESVKWHNLCRVPKEYLPDEWKSYYREPMTPWNKIVKQKNDEANEMKFTLSEVRQLRKLLTLFNIPE